MSNQELELQRDKLAKALLEMVWQHCYVDGKEIDSGCLLANEAAFIALVDAGYLEFTDGSERYCKDTQKGRDLARRWIL